MLIGKMFKKIMKEREGGGEREKRNAIYRMENPTLNSGLEKEDKKTFKQRGRGRERETNAGRKFCL